MSSNILPLAVDATGGNALVTTMLILLVSALVSGIIDNIPYIATMTPMVGDLAARSPNANADALWWALALGADFGGNLTAVGASANVVMLGIARRADTDLVLGVHPQRRPGHRGVDRALRALFVAALLRPWVSHDHAGDEVRPPVAVVAGDPECLGSPIWRQRAENQVPRPPLTYAPHMPTRPVDTRFSEY